MKWYEGSIREAIQKARTENSLFLVYISGSDDLSHTMDETWEDVSVTEKCNQSNIVALKLKANSQECVQFSEIYHVICVPSTYFIGNDGKPLEITGGPQNPTEFSQTITRVLKMHRESATAAAGQTESTQPEASSTSSQQNNETTNTTTHNNDETMETQELSPTERAQRAQEVINRKRAERAQQEEQENLRKEKERLETGKQMTKFKQWKEDKEAEEVRDKIKKDKDEAKKARERIKKQIEQDRIERAARFKREKDEKETQLETKRAEKLRTEQEAAASAAVQRSATSRIQFRLPDGSSVTQQFSSDDCLETSRQFITQRIGVSKVSLCTTFPRRNFTEEDMNRTLKDLELTPSAAIVVTYSSGALSTPSGDRSGILALIIVPFMALWTFLYAFLFGRSQQSTPVMSEPMATTSSASSDRQTSQTSSHRRREGRLHDLRRDDNDSATWNGNSTQQM